MSSKGQILLIGLLIITVLALTIPLLIITTRSLFNRQVHAQRQEALNEVTTEAFQTIQYQFSQHPELWNRALQGDPLADVGFDGSKTFQGVKETPYTVTCSSSNQVQTVLVALQVTTTQGAVSSARVFRSSFIRKTLGVDVPQLGHVPAAVYLGGAYPAALRGEPGQMHVHWGSIVGFNTFALPDNSDDDRRYGFHPRKIIAGSYKRLDSPEDALKEVWQNAPLGAPRDIDLPFYESLAQADQIPDPSDSSQLHSAYFENQGSALTFIADDGYSITTGTDAVVISGNALFGGVGIDLNQGAMIITGSAVFRGKSQGLPLSLHVPAQSNREYPYLVAGTDFPCAGQATCQPTDWQGIPLNTDFRGFLYVQGNMAVLRDTVIAGVLRVDGTLYIASGKQLTVFYDDTIGRAISTTQLDIEQSTP